jgi:hypothetical protein
MVLDHSPLPCILGADFLGFAKVHLDFSRSTYTFAFQGRLYGFEPVDSSTLHPYSFPVEKRDFVSHAMVVSSPRSQTVTNEIDRLIRSFPALFPDQLGTVKGMVCKIDLTDDHLSAYALTIARPLGCRP